MKIKWKELIASLIAIWLPLIYALSIYTDLPQIIRGHFHYRGLGMPKPIFIWFLPVLLTIIQLIVCYTTTIKEIIDKQFVHFLYWLVPFINAVVYISLLLYALNPAFPIFKVNGIMVAIILNAVSYFLTRQLVADQKPAPRVLAYIFSGIGSILFLVSLFLF
ncbi:hypothetical protein [Streptococcus oricebi]|uniref:DUF1648 domain-containing protein n=1 Tax=Streptococcus oricebi TaxID=1547447 RepID=A0ABS5B4B3_9STRE|nr:hypothetical protein [Streptococcus oricebi]MBP2623313.1 hypothetical protein [Streptococcus oricebi]